MYFDQILILYSIKKFRSAVLSSNNIAKENSGANWTLIKPKYVKPKYFWAFWKAAGLGEDGNELTGKDQCIDLECALWLHIGRSTCKNYHDVFNEKTRYVNNYIQNPFTMGILQNADRVHDIFELAKYLATPIRNNYACHYAEWYTRDK